MYILISPSFSSSISPSPPSPQLNLAVSYEMTLQNEEALQLYEEAAADLESAVSLACDSQTPPTWLRALQEASCDSWDYPKLVWHNLAWKVCGGNV